MTHPLYSRLASITRSTAAFGIVSLSIATLAQAPAAQSPSTSVRESTPLPTSSKSQIREAQDAYLAGARLLDRNDLTGAEAQFEKALKLDPANHDYVMAAAVAREHRVTELVQRSGKARLLGQTSKAEALLGEARLLDPDNQIVTQHLPPSSVPNSFNPQT
ncbi:MAG: hypothetical protein ABI158_00085, partial [Edaphobacter sp.]